MCYKICVIICDMNSTLGSVVPLAMFHPLFAAVGAIDLEKVLFVTLHPFISKASPFLLFPCISPILQLLFLVSWVSMLHRKRVLVKENERWSLAEIYHLWNIMFLWGGRKHGTLGAAILCSALFPHGVPIVTEHLRNLSSILSGNFQVGGREKMQVRALSIHCK